MRYDTIPVKVILQTLLSMPITQKCQILSCDTLVANERYGSELCLVVRSPVSTGRRLDGPQGLRRRSESSALVGNLTSFL